MTGDLSNLNNTFKFMGWSVLKSIKHPRSPISYYYCHDCDVRMNKDIGICPGCGKQIGNSPRKESTSPVPWQASVILVVVGIGALIAGECLGIHALDRVGDALIFLPLGNMFGMSLRK